MHIFSVHSLVEGQLGCLQVLAISNNGAMNIAEQLSMWYDAVSLGCMLNDGAHSCRNHQEMWEGAEG